jgi:hypothetical protein
MNQLTRPGSDCRAFCLVRARRNVGQWAIPTSEILLPDQSAVLSGASGLKEAVVYPKRELHSSHFRPESRKVYPAKQPGVFPGDDNDGHANPESALVAGVGGGYSSRGEDYESQNSAPKTDGDADGSADGNVFVIGIPAH